MKGRGPKRYRAGGYRPGGRGQMTAGGVSVAWSGRDMLLSTVAPDAARSGADPTSVLRGAIRDALDPSKAPSKPKTFAEMTEAEKAEMRRLYEGKKP